MKLGLVTLLIVFPLSAGAQTRWSLGFEVGRATYSSAAYDTSADQVHLRPGAPILYSLRLARELGLALAVGYATSEWAVNIEDFRILTGDALRLFEVTPEVSYRLSTSSTGAAVRLHAGPLFDVWFPTGVVARLGVGALVGGALSLPLTALSVGGVSGSFLNAEDESAEIHRDGSMRRIRFGIGISRRL